MQRTLRIAIASVCLLSVASVGAAQGDGGTFTAQDYIEIQQLYAKYAQTLDLGDAEGWADTFTADGVFGETVGHEALKAFAAGFFSNFDGLPSITRSAFPSSHAGLPPSQTSAFSCVRFAAP